MQVARDIASVRRQVGEWRKQQQRIALVPTMGALHAGHFRLLERAQQVGDKVAASIFVNPIQFDDAKDLRAYPRDEAQDLQALERLGVALVFVPTAKAMHIKDLSTGPRVLAGELADDLCGAFRPEHFDGVATIVAKLLNIFQPHVILLGLKDYQQMCVVKALVHNLSFDVEVVAVETARAADGLALSSRNAYLSKQQRAIAPTLYRSIKAVAARIQQGDADFEGMKKVASRVIEANGLDLEYLEVRCANTLAPLTKRQFPLVVLAAAWLGKARLIDNIVVTKQQ